MSDLSEELTSEETAAMEEMQVDTPAPVVESEEPAKAEPEPESAQDAAAAKEAEFKSSRAEEKPPEGFVPHQAMHAERVKRQELEKKLADFEEKFNAQANPAEQPPEYVDPLEDPEGFKRWSDHQNKSMAERIEEIQNNGKQQAEAEQRMARAQDFEAQFAAKTPDYAQAAGFLHNQRISELRSQGFDDAAISAQIRTDANSIYDAAVAAGMNPAELVYYRARSAGFSSQPAPEPAAEQRSDGDKIIALADAQKNTQGVGSAGGGAQSGKITASQLAEMSEEELANIPDSQLREIMGG